MSSALASFRAALRGANRVVALTGAGISAESGIPTFRGAGGLWRQVDATQMASPGAFDNDPSLVWEFYHHRREHCARCAPNAGHAALARLHRGMVAQGKGGVTVVTQNVDRLHHAADRAPGAHAVVELHGSLWLLKRADGSEGRYVEDGGRHVWEDRSVPLVPALAGTGDPAAHSLVGSVGVADLPHAFPGEVDELDADHPTTRTVVGRDAGSVPSLARPAVVWFGENLDPRALDAANDAVASCDLLLVVGTSSQVYPAAGLAPVAAARGAAVAEFNVDPEPAASPGWYFEGKAGELLPDALRLEDVENC